MRKQMFVLLAVPPLPTAEHPAYIWCKLQSGGERWVSPRSAMLKTAGGATTATVKLMTSEDCCAQRDNAVRHAPDGLGYTFHIMPVTPLDEKAS